MLRAVMTKPGVVNYEKIEKPVPGKDEILVKIKRLGICGSDIHVFYGKHPSTDYPIVQGHEVSGTIEELGPAVYGFTLGEKVVLMPQVTCSRCYSCMNGMYHICDELKVMGFQTNGAAQEYFAINKEMVLKIPENITLEEGAIIEPAAVALHALGRGGNISGKKVLVLGAGTIGNLVGQTAKGLGASKVVITDLSVFRLNLAKECGIDFTVNSTEEDLEKAILENLGQDRADMILECVGSQETISQAISVARRGSKIIIVGVYGERPTVDLGLVQDRELSLIGTLMYQKNDFLKAIELAKAGELHLKRLITDHFPFLNFIDAYKYISEKKDKIMKVMVSL